MAREFVGIELGGCKIVSKVGGGGMGAVYKAIQINLNAPVALKVMAQAFAEDEGARQMFEREAREVAKLRAQTPNVVQIYDFGLDKDQGLYYITMELVEGEGLNSLLKRAGKLPEADAARVARQAAAGLEAARIHDIVHRDIKPDNILISKAGVVKITDFGLAKSVSATGLSVTAGRMLGTPAYMAPEQADAAEVDHRTDIYSLGATLYTMLTGALPSKADTPVAMAMKHIRAPVPDPRALVEELSPQMSTLVQRMMAKRPEDRPQTAGEVAKSLDAIIVNAVQGGGPGAADVSENTLMMVEVGGDGSGSSSSVNITDEVPDSVRLTPSPGTPPPAITGTQPTLSPEEAESAQAAHAGQVGGGKGNSGLVLIIVVLILVGGGVAAAFAFMGGKTGTGPQPPGPGPTPGPRQPRGPVKLALKVTSPRKNAVLAPGNVEVKGTIDGPSDAWVLVQGDPANAAGGRFKGVLRLKEGKHTIKVEAGHERAKQSRVVEIPVIVDGTSPEITLTTPPDALVTRDDSVAVAGTAADLTRVAVTVNGTKATVDADGKFSASVPLKEGATTITVEAVDQAGKTSTVSRRVVRDLTPPTITFGTAPPEAVQGLPAEYVLQGRVDAGATALTVNGTPVTLSSGRFEVTLPLKAGANSFELKAVDGAGNRATKRLAIAYQRWPKGLEATGDPKIAKWPADGAEMVEAKVNGRLVYVDRDEVTVAQYATFLAAVGASPDKTKWDHPRQPAMKKRRGHTPKFWNKTFRTPDTRPVVGIDWWDAWAYAKWAGKRLPTDDEWVAAAGGQGRSFPWGSARPNPQRAHFGVTARRAVPDVVGKQPDGAAPSGARDMAGNVWEWCEARGDKQPIRGGGWNSPPDELKISSRQEVLRAVKLATIGFRCAWSPSGR